MYTFEKEARAQGYSVICGVDEAGRGPLAGPVCAAAVVLPENCSIEGLNDSKKLTEKQRDALYDPILEQAVSYGIAFADETEIDAYNILQATFLAMRRAVAGLHCVPSIVLVDGNRDPHITDADGIAIPTKTIVHGDALSASIAAASILAKVTRDRYMLELDQKYPQYGFAVHKGYPTKAHYAAVEEYGVSPVHRRSFFAKRPWLLEKEIG